MKKNLTTKRLILEVPTLNHSELLVEVANSRDIADMLSSHPYPFTLKDAKFWIKKVTTKDDYQGFLIVLDNEIIGVIEIDISIEHNHATISYFLAKKYWNQGYMSEAVKRVIEFCFDDLGLIRVASHHFSNNIASKKVLLKSGFLLEGVRKKHFRKNGEYLDICDYGILK